MLSKLRDLVYRPGRFRLVLPRRGLPKTSVRLLQVSDFARCEEIYRANEAQHFPPHHFSFFSEWLRDGKALVLVAETAGRVEAVGGISACENEGQHFAALSFGMVDPRLHREGYGTALLLARLTLLHTEKPFSGVLLTPVPNSERYFARFGFAPMERKGGPASESARDDLFAWVSRGDCAMCLAKLAGNVALKQEIWSKDLPAIDAEGAAAADA